MSYITEYVTEPRAMLPFSLMSLSHRPPVTSPLLFLMPTVSLLLSCRHFTSVAHIVHAPPPCRWPGALAAIRCRQRGRRKARIFRARLRELLTPDAELAASAYCLMRV